MSSSKDEEHQEFSLSYDILNMNIWLLSLKQFWPFKIQRHYKNITMCFKEWAILLPMMHCWAHLIWLTTSRLCPVGNPTWLLSMWIWDVPKNTPLRWVPVRIHLSRWPLPSSWPLTLTLSTTDRLALLLTSFYWPGTSGWPLADLWPLARCRAGWELLSCRILIRSRRWVRRLPVCAAWNISIFLGS